MSGCCDLFATLTDFSLLSLSYSLYERTFWVLYYLVTDVVRRTTSIFRSLKRNCKRTNFAWRNLWRLLLLSVLWKLDSFTATISSRISLRIFRKLLKRNDLVDKHRTENVAYSVLTVFIFIQKLIQEPDNSKSYI